MSRTLKLSEQLLALGQTYSRLGRDGEALRVLGKLASFGELPSHVADQTGSHLAELYFRKRNFSRARRHLSAGLARKPNNARFHFLMATSLMEDENGDLERALQHYHLAVRLEPDNAEHHCDYGLCLLSVGDESEGLKHLEKAQELAPDDVQYVRHLAMAQLEAGRPEPARRTVLALLFRRPRDPQARKLWNDVRFQEVHLAQRQQKIRWGLAADQGPVLLPFAPRPEARARGKGVRTATLRLRASGRRRPATHSRRQNP